MNIPIKVSFGRLLIAIVSFILMFLDIWLLASILLLISLLMDILDGILARKLKQVTNAGIYLDVMVDKIVIISTFMIVGIKLNVVFFYLGLLMLLREYGIDTMRSIVASKNKVISADKFSKIKGVLFMVAMLGVIFNYALSINSQVIEHAVVSIGILAMILAYITLIRFFIKYKELII